MVVWLILGDIFMSKSKVPVTKVRKKAKNAKGDIVPLTGKELEFLKVYAETLDKTKAAKAAGYPDSYEAMQSDKICSEMERINDAWFYENRMNAKFASGEHQRLMEKFEGQYDKTGGKTKAQFAGVLAKMSESSLKATGKIGGNSEGGEGTRVFVQLNIGNDSSAEVVLDEK